MTKLPLARYKGAETHTAEDAAGNVFLSYQGPNNAGVCVILPAGGGAARVIPTPLILGRPSFECNPLVGLWVVGNQEVAMSESPPRHRIAEYVPFRVAGIVGAAEVAVGVYQGEYASDAEVLGPPGLFVRLNKLKAAIVQLQRLAKSRGWLE